MARRAPPRFVVRTTVATLVMVAGVLTAVFVGVTFDVRDRVHGAVMDKLEAGQRMLSALEAASRARAGVQVATLAENPTLKAAVDTYQAGARHGTTRRSAASCWPRSTASWRSSPLASPPTCSR